MSRMSAGRDKNDSQVQVAYLVSRRAPLAYSVILQEARRLSYLGVAMQVVLFDARSRRLYRLTLESNTERGLVLYTQLGELPCSAWARLKTWITRPLACLRGRRAARLLPRTEDPDAGGPQHEVQLAVRLAAWLRRQGFTHVHAQSTSPTSRLAHLMAASCGLGYSLTLVGADAFAADRHRRLRVEVEAAVFVRCLGRYGRVALRHIAPSVPEHKLEVVPPGVDTMIFQPVVFRRHPQPCEIVSVGRLEAARGQDTLLAACAQLVARGHDIRLRLIGEGPDEERLRARSASLGLAERVSFEGKIDPIGLRRFYLRTDIFALANTTAGLSVALMEAMAMAIPCVSTTAPGLSELIRPERDGLLVAPGAADRMADALERLVMDADLRRRLGQAGLVRVLERYELESCALALSVVLARHLGPDAPRGRQALVASLPARRADTCRGTRRPTPSVRGRGRYRDHDRQLLATLAALAA